MITLYHYPFCPHSRFVRLALDEYGIEPRLIEERPWERRREFLLMSPEGTTPVIIEDRRPGISGADVIAEYLDETRGFEMGERRLMPHVSLKERFKKLNIEVELGFSLEQAAQEAQRCLNCDIQTVFTAPLCIECDACVDICPMDCITFTENGEEADLRERLKAPSPHLDQDLYVADGLKTGRVMVKDEDVCLHCSLCAERCPTGAWDMQKYLIDMTHAGSTCQSKARSAA